MTEEAAGDDLAIDARNLKKSFDGKTAVNGASLKIRRGEIFGFLGPNGSGKTTTIRMLCGLLTPDEGGGTCLGYDLREQQAQIKKNIGYMTQRFSLYEDLSVRENMMFIARMYGVANPKEAVDEAIGSFGFAGRQNQLAGELSGGLKQRLALATCLLHRPRLLLLDEPTAGVDPKARRDFWNEIHRLSLENVTTLVSTHYIDEAERCHRLGYIAYGDLLAQGAPEDLARSSGLVTWIVRGKEAGALADRVLALPGVAQAAVFGDVLRVSGYDSGALEGSMKSIMADSGVSIERTEPNLEDVFISLLKKQEAAT